MNDMDKIIEGLRELHGSKETMKLISDTITMLKEQEAEIRQLRLALDIAKGKCNGIQMSDDTVKSTIDSLDRIWWRSIL